MTARTENIIVTRTARYATLGQGNADVRQVWFVCHGYGHLAADFIENFRELDDGSRLIVAPEGLSRFYLDERGLTQAEAAPVGATWMTREQRESEIDDYIDYLDRLYTRVLKTIDAKSVQVVLLGFSQGASTAMRWFARGGSRIDRLILWAGAMPPEVDLHNHKRKLGITGLSIVWGRNDPYLDDNRMEKEKARLDEHSIAYELVLYDGGHEIDRKTLQKLSGEE